MELREKIRAKLKGSAVDKNRREEILDEILRTFQQGGPEAATAAMKRRLDDFERELGYKLTALRKKL
jgi:hypothetical protein